MRVILTPEERSRILHDERLKYLTAMSVHLPSGAIEIPITLLAAITGSTMARCDVELQGPEIEIPTPAEAKDEEDSWKVSGRLRVAQHLRRVRTGQMGYVAVYYPDLGGGVSIRVDADDNLSHSRGRLDAEMLADAAEDKQGWILLSVKYHTQQLALHDQNEALKRP